MLTRASIYLLATAALAQTAADITAAEKNWASKVLARDVKALERIVADDLIYAHSTGIIDTKHSYLAKIGEGRQVYTKVEHQKMETRLYGTTAITHCIMRMVGTNQAGPFDDKVMMMHVWVKKSGAWVLAAHQTTRIQ